MNRHESFLSPKIFQCIILNDPNLFATTNLAEYKFEQKQRVKFHHHVHLQFMTPRGITLEASTKTKQ